MFLRRWLESRSSERELELRNGVRRYLDDLLSGGASATWPGPPDKRVIYRGVAHRLATILGEHRIADRLWREMP